MENKEGAWGLKNYRNLGKRGGGGLLLKKISGLEGGVMIGEMQAEGKTPAIRVKPSFVSQVK